MISVRFHPAAETEMVEAAAWQEIARAGLRVMHLHREPGYWRERSSADDTSPHPKG